MSDEELRYAERHVSDGESLFRLTTLQMRHGIVSLTTLVTAIKHLENQAKLIAADELKIRAQQAPSEYPYPSEYRKLPELAVPIGHNTEQIKVWFTRPMFYGGEAVHGWVGLPRADSNFHLVPCPHCQTPIWSNECRLCGYEGHPSHRQGVGPSPWPMEMYLDNLLHHGEGSRNFYQFYLRLLNDRAVPEYQSIATYIYQTMHELDEYQWPSFEAIREVFCTDRGLCSYPGCEYRKTNTKSILNVFPYPVVTSNFSQIPFASDYCSTHTHMAS